jgi:hypothetical protein
LDDRNRNGCRSRADGFRLWCGRRRKYRQQQEHRHQPGGDFTPLIVAERNVFVPVIETMETEWQWFRRDGARRCAGHTAF